MTSPTCQRRWRRNGGGPRGRRVLSGAAPRGLEGELNMCMKYAIKSQRPFLFLHTLITIVFYSLLLKKKVCFYTFFCNYSINLGLEEVLILSWSDLENFETTE